MFTKHDSLLIKAKIIILQRSGEGGRDDCSKTRAPPCRRGELPERNNAGTETLIKRFEEMFNFICQSAALHLRNAACASHLNDSASLEVIHNLPPHR